MKIGFFGQADGRPAKSPESGFAAIVNRARVRGATIQAGYAPIKQEPAPAFLARRNVHSAAKRDLVFAGRAAQAPEFYQ
jgi:hypothetical protein